MKIFSKENQYKIIIAIVILLIAFIVLYKIATKNSEVTIPAPDNQTNSAKEDQIQNNDEHQEEEAMPTDSADINTIKKYYNLLSSGNLQEAYLMRGMQDVSFKEFSNWYTNIEYAKPDSFKNIGDNTYDFIVIYKEKDAEEKKYGVRMSVIDGKLKTASSSEFKAVEAKFEDYTAFSEVRGDKIYLILKKGNIENIIDVGDYSKQAIESGFAQNFSDLAFSPKGNYLIYGIHGWEYAGTGVYSIQDKKRIGSAYNDKYFTGAVPGDGANFTPDEKYFYYCLSNGLYSGVPGEVYSVPKFNIVFRAMDEDGGDRYMESVCGYEKSENAITFTLSDPFDEGRAKTKVIKYPLGR